MIGRSESSSKQSALVRVALPAALVLAALVAIIFTLAPTLAAPDTDAYWRAGMRLRDGAQLYPTVDPDAKDAFRYAPWFAWVWLPITFLPQDSVYTIWSSLLVVAAIASVLPLFRLGPAGIALGLIAGGILIQTARYGNVTPLMILFLNLSRLHPLAVGVAASLKVYPIFFVFGYVAERRWGDAAICLATAAVLWIPVLGYDLSGYATSPGNGGMGLWALSPLLWAGVSAGILGATAFLAIRGSQWTWFAASTAVVMVVPRFWPAQVGFLLPAVFRMDASRRREEPQDSQAAARAAGSGR